MILWYHPRNNSRCWKTYRINRLDHIKIRETEKSKNRNSLSRTIRKTTNRTETGTYSFVPNLWLSPEACEAFRNIMSTDVTALTAVTIPHRTVTRFVTNEFFVNHFSIGQ